METPHKVLYGLETDLSHLKINEAGTKTRHVFKARNVVEAKIPHPVS